MNDAPPISVPTRVIPLSPKRYNSQFTSFTSFASANHQTHSRSGHVSQDPHPHLRPHSKLIHNSTPNLNTGQPDRKPGRGSQVNASLWTPVDVTMIPNYYEDKESKSEGESKIVEGAEIYQHGQVHTLYINNGINSSTNNSSHWINDTIDPNSINHNLQKPKQNNLNQDLPPIIVLDYPTYLTYDHFKNVFLLRLCISMTKFIGSLKVKTNNLIIRLQLKQDEKYSGKLPLRFAFIGVGIMVVLLFLGVVIAPF